jgi:retron-type reverse transcriptase
MKRVGHLFGSIVERENLRLAVAKALKGQRDRPEAREFVAHLDQNLQAMAEGLANGNYPVGRFHQFVLYNPKRRIITVPCFAERVLHHAFVNVMEPHFERWLIADTFACRPGKGQLAALTRARQFARRFPFYLKLDIRGCFDSVPHDRLLENLTRCFKDARLLDWLERIVRSYRGELGRGIPIGSLMSQHFANFHLGWFDRFAKESLRVKGYVRYMDDMALWSDSLEPLQRSLARSRDFLKDELQLELKEFPFFNRSGHGLVFLGCRVFPSHAILNRRSRQRFRHKLAALEEASAEGDLEEAELQQRAQSLVAFTRQGGVCSWRFRQAVLQKRG